MNQTFLKKILTELVQINPDFISSQHKLKLLLEDIMIVRPQISSDTKFKDELRLKLEQYVSSRTLKKPATAYFSWRLAAVSFLLVGAITAGTLGYLNSRSGESKIVKIKTVQNEAFGEIIASKFTPLSGSGAGDDVNQLQGVSQNNVSGENFHFTYNGQLPVISDYATAYRMQTGKITEDTLSGIVASEPYNQFINLKKFGFTNLTKYENDSGAFLSSDSDLGYSLILYPNNIIIQPNDHWPTDPGQIDKEKAPHQAEVEKIAKDFLSSYEIDKSNLATPIVSFFPLDESMIRSDALVRFPVLFNEKPVYDYSGASDNESDRLYLTVHINLVQKRVSYADFFYFPNLEASNYKTKSKQEILSEMSEGGVISWINRGQGTTQEIILNQSEDAYQIAYYEGDILLIPSFVFSFDTESVIHTFHKVLVPLIGSI